MQLLLSAPCLTCSLDKASSSRQQLIMDHHFRPENCAVSVRQNGIQQVLVPGYHRAAYG